MAGIALIALVLLPASGAHAATVAVAPPAAGSATGLLQAALRDAVRRPRAPGEPVVLRLAGGIYRLDGPLTIGPGESGRPGAPVVIEGAADGSTRLVGSVPVAARAAEPADRPPGITVPAGPLDVIDLSGLTGTDGPAIVPRGAYSGTPDSRFELFQDGVRLTPSRWPRDGDARDVAARVDPDGGVRLRLSPEQVARWRAELALVVGGYWAADWAYERGPVRALDPHLGEAAVAPLSTPLPVRDRVAIRVLNALSEVDAPGRYALDPPGRRVFVRPAREGAGYEAAAARTLVMVEGAQHVQLRNLALSRTLGTPLVIRESRDVTVSDCAVGASGGRGIAVEGGRRVTIERCVVDDTAETGILLAGGDRRTLVPAGHRVVDSAISRFGRDSPTYRPGVEVQGVGNAVEGCLIREGAHAAILIAGNDHRIAGNEISEVVRETSDAGAIYAGRDWTARGNALTGNYLHDIGNGDLARSVVGVYLDDQFSGASIVGNVFLRVGRPVQIGGGRDNRIEGNAFLAPSRPAILFDARGETWQRAMVRDGALAAGLAAMPVTRPPWSTRYPSLARLAAEEPGRPLGNIVARNLVFGAALIEVDGADAQRHLHPTQNWELPAQEAPADAAPLLARLAAERPALGALGLVVADRRSALARLLHAVARAP